jgi:photosystem II stability/assembly factor-like uncharacterized protein
MSKESVFVATDSGLFFSPDSGVSWSNKSPEGGSQQIPSIAVSGSIIYATSLDTTDLLYCSTNQGSDWTFLGNDLEILGSCGSTIFAESSRGTVRSIDSGVTWTSANVGLLENDSTNIGKFASIGNYVIIGPSGTPSEGMVYLSSNFGESWIPLGTIHRLYSLGAVGPYALAGSDVVGTYRQLFSNASAKVEQPTPLPSFYISPNPTSGMVTISGSITRATVTNVLGETILQIANPNASETTLDLTNEPAGTYFVRVESANGTTMQKIVKE